MRVRQGREAPPFLGRKLHLRVVRPGRECSRRTERKRLMRPWEFTFDSGVIRMFPQPLPMEGQQIASELCEQPELEKEIERLEERIEESESEIGRAHV